MGCSRQSSLLGMSLPEAHAEICLCVQAAGEDTQAADAAAPGEQRGQPGEDAGHPQEHEKGVRDPGLAHTTRTEEGLPGGEETGLAWKRDSLNLHLCN